MSEKFTIKLDDVKDFFNETADLVKKTDNDFPISEDEFIGFIGDEEALYKDQELIIEAFTDIVLELEEDDIDLYSEELKEKMLDDFNKFTESIDPDEVFINEVIEIDMTEKKKEKPKKAKEEKKNSKGKESPKEVKVTFEECLDFFLDVKERAEDEDILISEELFVDDPNESQIIEVVKDIMSALEDDDIDELERDESKAFYKKYKSKNICLEDKKEDEKETKNKKGKKESAKEESKEKPEAKAKDKTKESKEESKKSEDIKIVDEPSSGCKCSGEKTLIIKGDSAIIESITKMIEAISSLK